MTLDASGSSAAKQKPATGEPGRALEEDKVWDPLLLFPRGVWTAITLRKFPNEPDHKRIVAHHNRVRAGIKAVTRSRSLLMTDAILRRLRLRPWMTPRATHKPLARDRIAAEMAVIAADRPAYQAIP
ncbi:hypothetical protein X743_23220 [Mesorhizobium sp. LNHC252B00]|nr:hypothetical protein X743_23220 [Mesorhizobium sp. LNHC252B00]